MPGTTPVEQVGGTIRSLDRAFTILEAMAEAGGAISVTQLANDSQLPLATIHRQLRALVELGYVRQEASRQYSLGPRLLRLARAGMQRLEPLAYPHLRGAVDTLGESVNLAIMDGDEVVYVASVQPSHNLMRMFTEVGGRASPHATAVGKAMLAASTDAEAGNILARTGMRRCTPHTLTDSDEFLADLAQVRRRGYALDDEEQEIGVRCVAVAVPDAPRAMAMSVSGPLPRMSDATVEHAVPTLHAAAAALGAELAG